MTLLPFHVICVMKLGWVSGSMVLDGERRSMSDVAAVLEERDRSCDE
jgi:hypothetical protein